MIHPSIHGSGVQFHQPHASTASTVNWGWLAGDLTLFGLTGTDLARDLIDCAGKGCDKVSSLWAFQADSVNCNPLP